MSKKIYIGIDNVARKVKKEYIGIDGLARKIKKAYIGVGGVARPCLSSGLSYYGNIEGLSTVRQQLSGASTESYALFAGGMGTSSASTVSTVQTYDSSLTVGTASNLSYAVEELEGVSFCGYALFGGGSKNSTHSSSNVVTTMNAYNNSLVKSNPSALRYSAYALAAASNDTYAIFAGGSYNALSQRAYTTAYNSSLTRSSPANLPKAVEELAAVSVGNYLLFYGGQYYNDDSNIEYSFACTAYDKSLTKTTFNTMEYRAYHKGVTLGNRAIFAGGNNDATTSHKGVCFDESLTVTFIDNAVSIPQKWGISAAKLGDYAIFAGGRVNGTSLPSTYKDSVDVFDSSFTRQEVDNLQTPKAFFAGATVGGYAIFAGGYNGTTGVLTDAVAYTA